MEERNTQLVHSESATPLQSKRPPQHSSSSAGFVEPRTPRLVELMPVSSEVDSLDVSCVPFGTSVKDVMLYNVPLDLYHLGSNPEMYCHNVLHFVVQMSRISSAHLENAQ